MKHYVTLIASLAALLIGQEASAEEGRFDTQAFRPAAAPRDLVMVQKSEVIGHLSPTLGVYYDVALDPLSVVIEDTGQAVNAVAARMQLTGLVGMGFFGWFDVSLAVPFIAWQTGDNLRRFGTEGSVQTPAFGDVRLSTKVALPFFNRRDEIKEGFGMSLGANLNFPTGAQNAFAGDGALSGGTMLIADYRFNFGLIVATNFGVWIRPERQFAGVLIGDMAQFGGAAEMYVVQRWGLSVLGEVYGYPSLTSFPDSPKQIPAEALLGLRWQTKQGITITVGGSFGAACGFGSPAIRFFNGITWQPKSSYEQEEINRLQQRDIDDPDHDGLIDEADRCPNVPGLPVNLGCPDEDMDGDGVVDREDECPDLASGPRGKNGCPLAYIRGDEIVILDQVHFATDKDIILDESQPVLEDVSQILNDHPEIREVLVEGHTDVRASDAYNMNLSQRRVNSVKAALTLRGVEAERITAKGFGHTQPVYDDASCRGPDETLSAECRLMTSKNRRVVFRIVRYGAPPPKAIGAPAGGGGSSVLPSHSSVLPNNGGALPTQGTLKKNSALPSQGTLKPGTVIEAEPVLPGSGSGSSSTPGGVLPKRNGVLPKK